MNQTGRIFVLFVVITAGGVLRGSDIDVVTCGKCRVLGGQGVAAGEREVMAGNVKCTEIQENCTQFNDVQFQNEGSFVSKC